MEAAGLLVRELSVRASLTQVLAPDVERAGLGCEEAEGVVVGAADGPAFHKAIEGRLGNPQGQTILVLARRWVR